MAKNKIKVAKTEWQVSEPEFMFGVKCPYCNGWTDHNGLGIDGDLEGYTFEKEVECPDCGKKFHLEVKGE